MVMMKMVTKEQTKRIIHDEDGQDQDYDDGYNILLIEIFYTQDFF